MNVDLYLLRGNEEYQQNVNKELPIFANTLKQKDIHIIYKTELDQDAEKILQGVLRSFSPVENIDLVLIPNGYSGNVENSVVYKALCSVASAQVDGKTFANAVALDCEGECKAYCFFLKDKRILLMPQVEAGGLSHTVPKCVTKALQTEELSKEKLAQAGMPVIADASVERVMRSIENDADTNNTQPAQATPNRVLPLGNAKTQLDFMETPEVAAGVKVKAPQEKGKKRRNRRFLPQKGDSAKEVCRKLLLDVAIIAFIVAAIWLIYELFITSAVLENKMDVLRAENPTTITKINEEGEKIKFSHDWDYLKGVNKEIVAWVKIDDTKIDYPVLHHKKDTEDDQYYLYKDYEKNYDINGSVFVDYRCEKSVKSKNVILHGHNMLNGSMFQNLVNYGGHTGNLDYYKDHPTIHFDTPEGDQMYKIISVFKTSTLDNHGEFFNYMTSTFTSDAEFMNYVYLVRERSLFDIPVKVNEKDELLTLSTCSYEYDEFRTVVVARKVRKGEDEKVNVKTAELNPNPLWPDVKYGGDLSLKPKVTTFSKANKAGEITWYDGKGKLKGTERMFTLNDSEKIEEHTQPTQAPTEAPVVESQEEQYIEIPVTGISLDPTRIELLKGEGGQIKINWEPSDANVGRSITWITSNVNVVEIKEGGVITAVSSGTATITVKTDGGKEASCEITVTNPAQNIALSEGGKTLDIGETFKLNVAFTPSDADNQVVNWSSNNAAVASVAQDGTVTARRGGVATITAQVDGFSAITCAITVNEPVAEQSAEEVIQ